MTHWGWYWKYKKRHRPKALCSWSSFNEIDSFAMFKNKQGLEWVRESPSKLLFEIFSPYKIKVMLLEDDSLQIECEKAVYKISVEKKPCNYGGYYRFFHCPHCDRRMRKLYCLQGIYLCRKCANLGYLTQRLRPDLRHFFMRAEIEKYLQKKAGSLKQKPPRMHHSTFKKMRKKYVDHDEKSFYAKHKELKDWYGLDPFDRHYGFFVRDGFYDVYDCKDPED